MSAIMSAFKVKTADLEPIFASWTDAPVFKGNSKKDLPVETWLDQIKEGCVARKLPEECWHKVAQHYMGSYARTRLEEFKKVLYTMHGGKYRWTWKKFCTAMTNMGWNIDSKEVASVKVQKLSSGSWWIVGKKEEAPMPLVPVAKSASKASTASKSSITSKKDPSTSKTESKESPSKHKSEDSKSKRKHDSSTSSPPPRKTPIRAMSDSIMAFVEHAPPVPPKPQPHRANSDPIETTVANAPVWLLNACKALDFLTSEHPKTMTAISAILITAGSLPAMPAIAGGAGGAILASHAAQAIGAVAVGLGTWLKASQEGTLLAEPAKSKS